MTPPYPSWESSLSVNHQNINHNNEKHTYQAVHYSDIKYFARELLVRPLQHHVRERFQITPQIKPAPHFERHSSEMRAAHDGGISQPCLPCVLKPNGGK